MPRTGARAGLVAGLAGVAVAASLSGCGGWDAPGRDQVPVRAESGGDLEPAPQPGPSSTASPRVGDPDSGFGGGSGGSGGGSGGEGPRAGDFVLRSFPEVADFFEEDATAADFSEFAEEDFAACLAVAVERVEDRSIESAYGPLLYDEASQFSLTSTASIVAEETIANDREIMQLPAYPRCFAEAAADVVLEDSLASLGEGSGLAIEIRKAEFAATPPGATARITTIISMLWPDETHIDIYYDVIMVLEGRVEATVHASGGEPLPEDVVAAAVAQVVEKVDNQ
jgi:hypothetical protein